MTALDSKLRQRVVGAVVLTMLAILILPMLLDGSAVERERVLSQLPEAPDIEASQIDMDEVLLRIEQLDTESAEAMPESRATTNPSTASISDSEKTGEEKGAVDAVEIINRSLGHDEDGLPLAWSLQVASFSKEDNALALREKLRKDKHQAYIYRGEIESGAVYRVFVGPMLSKTLVDSLVVTIKKDYDLEGRVVPYDTAQDKDLVGG